jgi:hypothetical protein
MASNAWVRPAATVLVDQLSHPDAPYIGHMFAKISLSGESWDDEERLSVRLEVIGMHVGANFETVQCSPLRPTSLLICPQTVVHGALARLGSEYCNSRDNFITTISGFRFLRTILSKSNYQRVHKAICVPYTAPFQLISLKLSHRNEGVFYELLGFLRGPLPAGRGRFLCE